MPNDFEAVKSEHKSTIKIWKWQNIALFLNLAGIYS